MRTWKPLQAHQIPAASSFDKSERDLAPPLRLSQIKRSADALAWPTCALRCVFLHLCVVAIDVGGLAAPLEQALAIRVLQRRQEIEGI